MISLVLSVELLLAFLSMPFYLRRADGWDKHQRKDDEAREFHFLLSLLLSLLFVHSMLRMLLLKTTKSWYDVVVGGLTVL